jgi:hypothetical protein
MSINNTITVYHRGGPDALRTPPIGLKSAPATASTSVGLRGTVISPRDVVGQPDRNPSPPPSDPSYAALFDPYVPRKHTTTYVIQLQTALCVPDSEVKKTGSFTLTKALIKIFKMAERKTGDKLNDDEATKIREQGGCKAGGGQNYFERRTYDDPTDGPAAVKELIVGLRKTPAGETLPLETSLDGARTTIQAVRNAATGNSKLMTLPPVLSGQVTPDLLSFLRKS